MEASGQGLINKILLFRVGFHQHRQVKSTLKSDRSSDGRGSHTRWRAAGPDRARDLTNAVN
jgi:hypothetical protein